MRSQQLELPLFDPPTFDEVASQGGYQGVRVELSSRLRRSWRVIYDPATGVRTLRLPAALEQAPREVKCALLRWAFMPHARTRQRKVHLRRERAALEAVVWEYLGQVCDLRRRRMLLDRKALARTTQGTVYDLAEIFDTVNREYLGGNVDASIRWGSYATTTSYHRHGVDTEGNRFDLITIAGLYDHPDVPRFAIESVVYHEALHIVCPPYRRNGRTIYHGPEFRKAERAFPHFRQWRRWEHEHAARLIRSLRRRRGKRPR